MAKFKPTNNGNKGVVPKPYVVAKIKEPKCHVCQHPSRDQIDYLLAMKTPYSELQRLFDIDARSFSKHDKKHLQYEDEAVKQIIEHEAGLAHENLETGIQGMFLRRVALDVSIKILFDKIISGEIEIEAKDLPKMIELREKLDTNTATAQIEQYELQFNAFKDSVEEICPPEMLNDILKLVKEKLNIPDRATIQAPR